MIDVKGKSACALDIVSLGEVMVRFDPGDEPIETTRSFRVHPGGGEFNVAGDLAKVFGKRAAIVTALADNSLGRLVENMIAETNVDVSEILWRETDGASRKVRNGMYFTARGHGLNAATGCSDRGNTAVSQLRAGDMDFRKLFSEKGTRWFHTGGVFAGLSDTTPEVALEAMAAARESGAVVSYDMNYRGSLWEDRGGLEAANEVNRRLIAVADVVLGVEGFKSSFAGFDAGEFKKSCERVLEKIPNIKMFATPLRDIAEGGGHDFSGAVYIDGKVYRSKSFPGSEVFDRIGSGDAFAAGLFSGILDGRPIDDALNLGTAAAVLTLKTPGDVSGASLEEVEALAAA